MDNLDISVVIPTFNEAKTIAELIKRIGESFKGSGVDLEFIVVDDDSPDGTAAEAEALQNDYNVKVIVRKNERGLATAVARGFREAGGRLLAVSDGDLQHPPDTIFRLYTDMKANNADIVFASRKVAGGSTSNWEFYRIIISSTATVIAKFLLPVTLFKIQDATTGCFLFRKESVDISKLSPTGFKIFLEVLVRGKFKIRHETPFTFSQRSKGSSKMTLFQDILFLYHLIKLGFITGEIAIPLAAATAVTVLLVYGIMFLSN